MPVDLITVMEELFRNEWFAVLIVLSIISGVLYHVRYMRKGRAMVKNVLLGKPLLLLFILALVIIIVAIVIQFFDISLTS